MRIPSAPATPPAKPPTKEWKTAAATTSTWSTTSPTLFAKQEGLDPSNVRVYAGSSEPLAYTVLAFASPSRPLVFADPGYEAAAFAAKRAGAKSIPVPLADPKGAAAHDIDAMLSAAANPGVIYICNPNNPTGTCTPRADLEHAVAAAKGDTVLLIDEAYVHFCDAPRSLDFVKEGRNVIVLRTFSKIYGMAGLRMGFAIGRPDLLKKLDYFGRNFLPTTAVSAAIASLNQADLVATRKKITADTRTETMAWLKQQGYAVSPSESNCFMLDTRRPGKQVLEAMAAKDVYIGRIWPAWPTQVRITVGTPTRCRPSAPPSRKSWPASCGFHLALAPRPSSPRAFCKSRKAARA